VPSLCEVYPSICLTNEKKARKNLSRCRRKVEEKHEKVSILELNLLVHITTLLCHVNVENCRWLPKFLSVHISSMLLANTCPTGQCRNTANVTLVAKISFSLATNDFNDLSYQPVYDTCCQRHPRDADSVQTSLRYGSQHSCLFETINSVSQ
jgi:hypothetical protein